MKLLVLILTSSDIKLLKSCIKSVETQTETSIDFDLKIVVNTLNEEYYETVLKEISGYEIIRTESNGRPGKGHNSLLKIFQEQESYDYMFPIDGDDMIYPSALCQIKKFMNYNPDILHILLNDYCIPKNTNKKKMSLNHNFYLYSCFNKHLNYLHNTHDLNNPFKNPIFKCKTPSRIILVSRKIFEMDKPLCYGEDLTLYDDYPPFLQIMNDKKLNKILTSESNIYLYNRMNDSSASYNFTKVQEEDKMFEKYRQEYFVKDFDKELLNLDFKTVSLPEDFNLDNKIEYINKNFVEREVLNIKRQAKTDLKKAIFLTNYIQLYDETIIKFVIENTQKVEEKFYYLDLLLKYFPDGDNVKIALELSMKYSIHNKVQQYKDMFEYYSGNKINNLNIPEKNKLPQKTLVYYVGESQPFNGKDYQEKNVWGSEIAAIKLCEKMTKDYRVFVVCNASEEMEYNGITYLHIRNFNNLLRTVEVDHLIISRFTHSLLLYDLSSIENLYFLFHDTRCHEKCFEKTLPKYAVPLFLNSLESFKKLVFVSEWQKNNFLKIVSMMKYESCIDSIKEKSIIIPNGINPELFEDVNNIKKIPHKYIYHSDPSRGLSKLCEIIIELQKIYPETTLDIYFSHIEDKVIQDYVKEFSFINFRGKLPNDKLINELKTTCIWIYPNVNSHETFCIAALESMYSGNIPITIGMYGSGELVKDAGILMKKDSNIQDYVDIVQNLYENEDLMESFKESCLKKSSKYTWDNVGNMWKEMMKK